MNTDRVVIIPAAGRAVRFNSIPKELLPIADGVTCLQSAVSLARKVGTPLVITSPAKQALHQGLLPGVEMVVQDAGAMPELWGAIMLGMKHAGKVPAGVILADTVTDFAAREFPQDINFGVFSTHTPERFSVVASYGIVTKRVGVVPSKAWGVLMWNEMITEYFLKHGADYPHYDVALNMAFHQFSVGEFPLDFYHDLGSWQHYRHYLLTSSTP